MGEEAGKLGRPRKHRGREISLLVELGFSRSQIAKMTGLKRSSVKEYLYRLRKQQDEAVNKTVNKNPLKCSCGGSDFFVDYDHNEVVCKSCGMIVCEAEFDTRLPFNTTYALESDLAVDKSLGGTLSRKGLIRVLAKSNATKALEEKGENLDLGLRARQIRVITKTIEHPQLASLLKRAYEVTKRFNMEDDKLFNNDLGKNIRRTFWLMKELGLEKSRRTVVETVFWLTLCQYGMKKQMRRRLDVDSSLLNLALKLNHFLHAIEDEETTPETAELAIQYGGTPWSPR